MSNYVWKLEFSAITVKCKHPWAFTYQATVL